MTVVVGILCLIVGTFIGIFVSGLGRASKTGDLESALSTITQAKSLEDAKIVAANALRG
jgi:hypothetical protein